MLRPDIVVQETREITPELLRRHGVEGVLVDLDDTIVASGSEEMAAGTREWLLGLQAGGFPLLILSNGERKRVARWAGEFGIPGLHLSGKPFAPAFRRGLRLLGTPAERTAMVGDQLFTDVLGANLAGMVSVLVAPLSPGKLLHTRAIRRLERRLLRGGGHGGPVHR